MSDEMINTEETVVESNDNLNKAEEVIEENKDSNNIEEPATGLEPSKEEPTEIADESNEESKKGFEPDMEINLEAIVEGLLYMVGDDGIKLEQLAAVIKKGLEDTEAILSSIQAKYNEDTYGIELVGYGKNYKFITKREVAPYIQELFHTTKPNTLSQSALETLAIIAYKQPITRVEIEELRGVGADMMLRKLQARNLIREAGRSDAPGKPILYEVTEEFMDSFKLYTLNELPDLPEFNTDEESENLFE